MQRQIFCQTLEETFTIMVDLQWGFSSARVNVRGRSPVVIYKVWNTIDSEPHFPPFWKWLFIQQPKKQIEILG